MSVYHDSVGNGYRSVPPAKHPPKQGPGKAKRHGRNKRKPSAQRYLAERRWEKHRASRAVRRERRLPRPSP